MGAPLLHQHEVLYLSRRNLQTLLNKLDRNKTGGESGCTLIKHDNTHPVYPATMSHCIVAAVEDEEYYRDRGPGDVFHRDQPKDKIL